MNELTKSSPVENIDYSYKNKLLTKIEKQVMHFEHSPGPRSHRRSLTIGLLWGIGVAVVLYALDYTGVDFKSLPWKDIREKLSVLPGVVVLMVYLYMRLFSNLSDTWTEEIDKLLALYEPTDRKAYWELQQRTKEYGYFAPHILRSWINAEREAITPPRKIFQFRFLNKSLEE